MRKQAPCIFLCGVLLSSFAHGEDLEYRSWFAEEAALRGVDFRHQTGATGEFLLPEIMGSGVALLDVDQDLDLDIYLIQSGVLGSSGASAIAGNALYINDGTGHFHLKAADSNAADSGYGMGVAAGDYDNDGRVDLYVTNVGANVLLKNIGSGQFQDETAKANVGDHGFGTSTTFVDLDLDGDLDLFVANYVDWQKSIERPCYAMGSGGRNYCDPGNYDRPSEDVLYRNNGDGTFTNITDESGVGSVAGNGLGVVTDDFNADGLPDIFVANDKTMNHLWINQGELKFKEKAIEWGCATDDHGIAKAGMGVTSSDFDNDSDRDLVVVNIQGETDSYFQNEGRYFIDASSKIGLTSSSRRYTRFGIAVGDFNADGYLDLYQANGRVNISTESELADVFAEPNLLFKGSASLRFDALPHAQLTRAPLVHTSRGVAMGDLNGDNALDLVVSNREAAPYILINQIGVNRPNLNVRLQLNQDGRQTDLGASISAKIGSQTIYSRVQVGGSYLSANSPLVHFVPRAESGIDQLRVTWSDQSNSEVALREAQTQITILKNND